jgi:hypothetical protein
LVWETARCCAQREVVQFVFTKTAPADEPKPSSGTQRPPDVGERYDRISEKHHAEARKGGVERPRLKGIRLRIATQEGDVFRQARIALHHVNRRLKQIHPDNPPRLPDEPGERTRRTPNAAANVEHPLAGQGLNRCDCSLTQRTELAFEGLADFKP